MSCPLICPGLGFTAVHWLPLICPGFQAAKPPTISAYMSWFGGWGDCNGRYRAEGAKVSQESLKYTISTYMSCPLICPGLAPLQSTATYMSWTYKWQTTVGIKNATGSPKRFTRRRKRSLQNPLKYTKNILVLRVTLLGFKNTAFISRSPQNVSTQMFRKWSKKWY